MNTIIICSRTTLFAVVVIVAAVAVASTVLEIGIINVTQAQEEEQQSPFISPLIPFAPPHHHLPHLVQQRLLPYHQS
jgi:hypothetical protein